MNKALFSLMLTALAVSPGCSKRREFAIPIHIVRKDGKTDVKGFTIAAKEFGDSKILGQDPGVTDANGDATIRFESEEEMVEMHYEVQEAPGTERWYVRFFGFLPTNEAELPQHSAHALPVKSTPLPLEAFSASQCAAVAAEDLTKNNTSLIATAVAAAVAVPGDQTAGTNNNIKLNDPLLTNQEVARILHTSPDKAQSLIDDWQKALERTRPNDKPDEKSLAALVKGDLVKAADFAAAAHNLPANQKAKLTGIRDTTRLVETVYQLNAAALDPRVPPTAEADKALQRVRNKLEKIRPPEGTSARRWKVDPSNLDNFSNAARRKVPE